MFTLLVFLIDGLVLGFFAIKIILSLNKTYNPFMFYFACVASFLCLNFLVYVGLIGYSIATKQPGYLYWADYLSVLFVYIGSVFAVQIPLYKLAPKRPERIWGSIVVGALAISLAIGSFIYPNKPYIDSLQIIHWQSPPWLAFGLALMIIGIWIPTSIIFLLEYVKSKKKLTKTLLLGIGFLLASIGSALQNYGTTVTSYVVINIVLLVGFLLIFFGILSKGPDNK